MRRHSISKDLGLDTKALMAASRMSQTERSITVADAFSAVNSDRERLALQTSPRASPRAQSAVLIDQYTFNIEKMVLNPDVNDLILKTIIGRTHRRASVAFESPRATAQHNDAAAAQPSSEQHESHQRSQVKNLQLLQILEQFAIYRQYLDSETGAKLQTAKKLLDLIIYSDTMNSIFDTASLYRLKSGLRMVEQVLNDEADDSKISVMIGLVTTVFDAAWAHLMMSDEVKHLLAEIISTQEFRQFVKNLDEDTLLSFSARKPSPFDVIMLRNLKIVLSGWIGVLETTCTKFGIYHSDFMLVVAASQDDMILGNGSGGGGSTVWHKIGQGSLGDVDDVADPKLVSECWQSFESIDTWTFFDPKCKPKHLYKHCGLLPAPASDVVKLLTSSNNWKTLFQWQKPLEEVLISELFRAPEARYKESVAIDFEAYAYVNINEALTDFPYPTLTRTYQLVASLVYDPATRMYVLIKRSTQPFGEGDGISHYLEGWVLQEVDSHHTAWTCIMMLQQKNSKFCKKLGRHLQKTLCQMLKEPQKYVGPSAEVFNQLKEANDETVRTRLELRKREIQPQQEKE